MINQICDKLKNKRILILGFGKEGRSTYRFIRKYLPDMVVGVYDKNEMKEDLPMAVLHTGNSYQDILADYDFIFKSPGIVFTSRNSKDIKKIISQTDLFLEFYCSQTIGITGTKGKSTTSSLLYHVLKSSGRDTLLAGNIGIPVFDVLDCIEENTIVVFELSSHQLEYATHSPHLALYLNLYQEHLDHYGTLENYAAAKENICKYQQKGDLIVYNKEFFEPGRHCKAERITISGTSQDADAYVKDYHIYYEKEELLINNDELLLKGQHNVYNIAAAYTIARYLGIPGEAFIQALKTFRPLPHRMEYVAEIDGVTFYNDSISTICETTIQGVRSVKNVDTVILGGMDRGIEYKPLVDFLLESEVSNLILMPDTGYRIRNLIANSDRSAEGKHIYQVDDVGEAVQTAKQVTAAGKVCLFSPAAASYGFFKNFEERGEVFKKHVMN